MLRVGLMCVLRFGVGRSLVFSLDGLQGGVPTVNQQEERLTGGRGKKRGDDLSLLGDRVVLTSRIGVVDVCRLC